MKYTNSKLFQFQLLIQIILLFLCFAFDFSDQIQALSCGVLLCTLGVPHGSNDYLYRKDLSKEGMVRFIILYLGAMVIFIGMWMVLPSVALILFFFISFHHFGQSNFENSKINYLPSLLWGIWILMFPLLLHFNEALQIFREMIPFFAGSETPTALQNDLKSTFNPWQIIATFILGASYLISLVIFEKKNFINYIVQFFAVTLWYVITPLLFGFIVVFCLWHSLQSLQHQSIYFKKSLNGKNLQFTKSMIPFSLIAILIFILYVHFNGFKIGEAFVLLSIITLPHVVVMHRLYENQSSQ